MNMCLLYVLPGELKRSVRGGTEEREILEGANFRINGRKAFRINFCILIFVCVHAGMPHPLVW